MTRTVLFNCPIKAEIRVVDSQSDLRILLYIMIKSIKYHVDIHKYTNRIVNTLIILTAPWNN